MREGSDGSWLVAGVGDDDFGWCFALVPSASVGSVVVVIDGVEVEFLTEPSDAGFGGSDEGGFEAFLEDASLDLFDFAVGLGTSRGDQAVSHSEMVEGFFEAVVDELVAAVGGDLLGWPSFGGEIGGDAMRQR